MSLIDRARAYVKDKVLDLDDVKSYIEEYVKLYDECEARLKTIYRLARTNGKYKKALEDIVLSSGGTFREIARKALEQ